MIIMLWYADDILPEFAFCIDNSLNHTYSLHWIRTKVTPNTALFALNYYVIVFPGEEF
jgi:hypothetical protein